MVNPTLLTVFCAAVVATMPLAALSDIVVSFTDSAPKDIFEVQNRSGCDLGAMRLTLDLSTSKAGLVFDTQARGAGVQVYQPFEIVQGADLLEGLPQVADGTSELTLTLSTFPAQARVTFTIDVDDTLTSGQWGQIRVAGSEMAGASIMSLEQRATFAPDGTALLPVTGCVG